MVSQSRDMLLRRTSADDICWSMGMAANGLRSRRDHQCWHLTGSETWNVVWGISFLSRGYWARTRLSTVLLMGLIGSCAIRYICTFVASVEVHVKRHRVGLHYTARPSPSIYYID